MRYSKNGQDWDVEIKIRDGLPVHCITIHKLKDGPHAGKYDPIFWALPMVSISSFIEPTYEYWSVFLDDEIFMTNLGVIGNRLATTAEMKRAWDDDETFCSDSVVSTSDQGRKE